MGNLSPLCLKSFMVIFQVWLYIGDGEQGDDFTEFMPVLFEPKTPQASMELPHGWQRIAKTRERTFGG